MDTPEEVTQLLIDWSTNDRAALDRLVSSHIQHMDFPTAAPHFRF